jgi:hypothetical protein
LVDTKYVDPESNVSLLQSHLVQEGPQVVANRIYGAIELDIGVTFVRALCIRERNIFRELFVKDMWLKAALDRLQVAAIL